MEYNSSSKLGTPSLELDELVSQVQYLVGELRRSAPLLRTRLPLESGDWENLDRQLEALKRASNEELLSLFETPAIQKLFAALLSMYGQADFGHLANYAQNIVTELAKVERGHANLAITNLLLADIPDNATTFFWYPYLARLFDGLGLVSKTPLRQYGHDGKNASCMTMAQKIHDCVSDGELLALLQAHFENSVPHLMIDLQTVALVKQAVYYQHIQSAEVREILWNHLQAQPNSRLHARGFISTTSALASGVSDGAAKVVDTAVSLRGLFSGMRGAASQVTNAGVNLYRNGLAATVTSAGDAIKATAASVVASGVSAVAKAGTTLASAASATWARSRSTTLNAIDHLNTANSTEEFQTALRYFENITERDIPELASRMHDAKMHGIENAPAAEAPAANPPL